jgi:hypothetical protein
MSVDLTELFENASAPPMFVDADRVLARGRRRRLRRRIGWSVAALPAVVIAAIVAGVVFTGLGSTGVTMPASGGLSSSRGSGPLASSITDDGFTGEAWQAPPWGPPQVTSRQVDVDGRYPVLYVTTAAMLCKGSAEADGSQVRPSTCGPIGRLPEEGFAGGGMVTSRLGNVPKGVDARWTVAGIVRGDITRVVISTPRGDVDATLAPAKDPRLGQLYWAETPVLASLDGSSAGEEHFVRIAYRGSEAVFSCDDTECS